MTAATPARTTDAQDRPEDTRSLDDALEETLGQSASAPSPAPQAAPKASAKAAKDPATKPARSGATKTPPKTKPEGGEGDAARELAEAVEGNHFIHLSKMLDEDAGTNAGHRAALHSSYLQAIRAKRIFGVPLSTPLNLGGQDAENSEQAPDEMVAKTPTFQAWREEASCEYYAAQMQREPAFGVDGDFAAKHFLTLATARTSAGKSGAKAK